MRRMGPLHIYSLPRCFEDVPLYSSIIPSASLLRSFLGKTVSTNNVRYKIVKANSFQSIHSFIYGSHIDIKKASTALVIPSFLETSTSSRLESTNRDDCLSFGRGSQHCCSQLLGTIATTSCHQWRFGIRHAPSPKSVNYRTRRDHLLGGKDC